MSVEAGLCVLKQLAVHRVQCAKQVNGMAASFIWPTIPMQHKDCGGCFSDP